MNRDFGNYKNKLEILMNILLARERSFNDPEINEFANQLISLPSRAFEAITDSMLPGIHLSIFREWYVENRMRTLHHQLTYSQYRYNDDLKNEHDDEKQNNLKQKLDAENQQITREINELQPFYDVFSLRHTINNYTDELRRLETDLNNPNIRMRPRDPRPHQQRVEYLQREIDRYKNIVENRYKKNQKLRDYCFDPERGYSPKKCQAQTRNRSSGRCRKTPCRLGKIRDVTSGQCRSRKRKSPKRKSPKKSRR